MAKLLKSHEYGEGGVHGNCGTRLAFRLVGSYQTEDSAKGRYKQLLDAKQLRSIPYKPTMGIVDLLRAIRTAEGGVAQARPYPVDWAFAEVLEALHYGSYALLCMTDTENGAGDGHKGPFATRHFAQWLQDNELAYGNCTTSVRYEDDEDNRREVYGWFFAPDKPRMDTFLKKATKEIIAYIEECNNDPEIKKQEEKAKTEAEATQAAIGRGYEGFIIDDPIAEQPVEAAMPPEAPREETFAEFANRTTQQTLGGGRISTTALQRARAALAAQRVPNIEERMLGSLEAAEQRLGMQFAQPMQSANWTRNLAPVTEAADPDPTDDDIDELIDQIIEEEEFYEQEDGEGDINL